MGCGGSSESRTEAPGSAAGNRSVLQRLVLVRFRIGRNTVRESGAAPTLSSFLSGLPVAMAVWYQDFMTTRTTLDQPAYRYSESACWTRSWADRSAVVRDGFSPTGSGRVGFYMKTCNPVYIEIEIDGQLFYAGWGEECDYRFFPYQEDRADPVVGRRGSDRGDRSPPNWLPRTHFTV